MNSPVKIFAVMVALGAALAAGPGLAQDDTPPTGRDVPHANGGAGEGVAIKGSVIPGGSDGSRPGPPPSPAGESKEGAVVTNRGIDPVRAESGSAGLQRRANLKALIANPPKMQTDSTAFNTRFGPPPGRPGAVGGATRDAIGVVVPGGGQGHTVPGSTASAGIGGHSLGSGVVGAGAATGNPFRHQRNRRATEALNAPVWAPAAPSLPSPRAGEGREGAVRSSFDPTFAHSKICYALRMTCRDLDAGIGEINRSC